MAEPVEATELEPFGEGTLLLALPEEWDQREYVWGPDYVDELAFQFDRDGRPLYAQLLNDPLLAASPSIDRSSSRNSSLPPAGPS